MDFELIDEPFNFNLSDIDELHDHDQCRFGTTSATSFQTSSETSDSFAIHHENSDYLDQSLSRLIQIEAQLMEVECINQNHIIGLESASYVNEETERNGHILTQADRIQVELLEESSLTELLFTGAEAVEAKNQPLASYVISRLKTLVLMDNKENDDNPFNRLALFFTHGLYNKSLNVAPEILHKRAVPGQSTNIMSAFQMLQELSPYVKFAHFTANQAIFEATRGDEEIHVIDFDIMEGSQWPSLMVDLAMRKGGPAASLRVTAFTVDDQQNVQQTGRRLKELADSINLAFAFDQVREEEFSRITGVGNAVLIGNCMIHQLHMPNRSFASVKTFLAGMRKLSPKIAVLVEEELFNFTRISTMPYVEFFCEAVHHYTALSDSLRTSFRGLGYKRGLKQIEEVLGIKIVDSVRQFPCDKEERMLMWGDGFFASLKGGFKPIPFTCYNISQANYLTNLFNKGYSVQHHNCRLALCWKSRPLLTASVWLPITESTQ